MRSPSQSGYNSRRTSWSSESAGSRDSRVGPFASPFDDSRAPSRAGSDDEGVNTQTVSEKYNIMPSAGLLLFPEDVEKDDYLHNPDPNEKEGRITCADLFSKRGITNLGGLILITLGIFMLFIGYPIMYVSCFLTFITCPIAANVSIKHLCRKIHNPTSQFVCDRSGLYQGGRVITEECPYRAHRSRHARFSQDKKIREWQDLEPCGTSNQVYFHWH